MKNFVYCKTKEKLRNWCKTHKQLKYYLKLTSKPDYISLEIFENDLVKRRKSTVKLKLNETAYFGMLVLDWSKILLYEFHYVNIKNKIVTKQDYFYWY